MSKLFKAFLAAAAITLAIIGVVVGTREGMDIAQRTKYPIAYGGLITHYAGENDLDPFLVMAVIHVESNFIPEAQSHVAYGLMQLTYETAEWVANDMKVTYDYDIADPETSINFGCYYLRHLINIYENIDTALAAYNAGMGNVNSWLNDRQYSDDGITLKVQNIPFPETRSYVEKVNASWEYYRTTDFADLDEDKGKIR